MNEKDIKNALNDFVKKGILKKKVVKGVEYWKETAKGKRLRLESKN